MADSPEAQDDAVPVEAPDVVLARILAGLTAILDALRAAEAGWKRPHRPSR